MSKTKIKIILEKKGMSQSDLFYKIQNQCKVCIGKDVISNIVNGKKQNYHIQTLLKICLALNCTPNDIIEKDMFMDTQIL
jgi:DNA-binding Xre family transcriptional regulator|tara:strand:+ start:4100 stop:4339 length:240 start_codon:yes stop_codon:yes gene_type:complete